MMKPILINATEVNRDLNYNLRDISDKYGLKFQVTLDLTQSSLDQLDVKLFIQNEGLGFDFSLPFAIVELRFVDKLIDRIVKYPTFLNGTLPSISAA